MTKPTVKPTKAQRRIAIARDALRRIGRKQIKPKQGTWLESREVLPPSKRPENLGKNLPKKCEACALGMVFISFAAQEGTVKVGDMEDNRWGVPWGKVHYQANAPILMEKLKKVFTPNQVRLIELAFEGEDNIGGNLFLNPLPSGDYNDALTFHQRYMKKFGNKKGYPTKALRAILRNIVRNDGVFKPADLTKVE